MRRIAALECLFPKLKGTDWKITSRRARRYNCFAWAAGESHRRWDCGKGSFWPKDVPRRHGIAYLIAAYMAVGFRVCSKRDGRTPDPQYEKIVVYRRGDEGEHAAKLLDSGRWSSKIGDLEDLEHWTPESLSGRCYGQPFRYMKRKRGGPVEKDEKPHERPPPDTDGT